jgi:cellulose synthase/poly-beta-1,6-N-acetylglucosamine synthase-like glycosyltransferase
MEDVLSATATPGALRASPEPLGRTLVAAGLLTEARLAEALDIQRSTGSPLGRILVAQGWLRPLDFYRHLAEHFALRFVNLVEEPPDPDLFEHNKFRAYAARLYVPWRKEADGLVLAVAEPEEGLLRTLEQEYGGKVTFVLTSRLDILWAVQRLASRQLAVASVLERARKDPDHSARQVLTWPQGIALGLLLLAAAVGLYGNASATLSALNAALGIFLLGSLLLRILLVWTGSGTLYRSRTTKQELDALDGTSLPVYSILIPLFRDAAVVPTLTRALHSLDYPRSKLDIKLILEGDDPETIEACKRAGLEGSVELIVVPPGLPRTKPKALNYALSFARGELLTIYDAEDIPEPDQLKRAVLAFRKAPPEVVCLQARLNYFNWRENWLTRMFTLEYSLWFDWYLPGLEALGIPIPLGGTSNHFRAEVIRAVGGWDPFNVTEDADLGIRFTMNRWRVGVLDSTTYEEANSQVWNWIRQRSRWVKGYIQTWLVYMRHPVVTLRRLGWKGFLGLHAFVGGAFLGPLAFPPLALMFLVWLVTRTKMFDPLFSPPTLAISLTLLLAGNGLLIYFHLLAAWMRQRPMLVFCSLLLPAYYFLISIAAWRGLWQLVTKPHYWEKTDHGLTSVAAHQGAELVSALEAAGQ